MNIEYPKSLSDIPEWRQRELEEQIRWFLGYTPSQRLAHIDREYREAKEYVESYSLVEKWKAKKK